MGMFTSTWFRRLHDLACDMGVADARVAAVPSRDDPAALVCGTAGCSPVWVIYATETGVAEDFARETCTRLRQAQVPAELVSLDSVDVDSLKTLDRVLFVVSTTGDGDPPDMADEFYRQCMQYRARLPGLHYGLMALGDSIYEDFCAFGRQLHLWLRASGAEPLFEPVLMDAEDETAAEQWREQVTAMARRCFTSAALAS